MVDLVAVEVVSVVALAAVLAVVVLAEVAPEETGNMAIHTLDQLRLALIPILEKIPKQSFLGAFAYGDCMEDFFQPKSQPFDIGLVFESVNPRDLPDLTSTIKAFTSSNARLGFLFTPDKIRTAADTFPLEFLNISQRHQVLIGNSPLQNFIPSHLALRHQCERELRGLLMHLHREYVLHSGNAKELGTLLSRTIPRFQPIFRGIYWLLNNAHYPKDSATCLAFIDSHWEFNGILEKAKVGSNDSAVLHSLAGDYISAIESIMKTIDRMEIPS